MKPSRILKILPGFLYIVKSDKIARIVNGEDAERNEFPFLVQLSSCQASGQCYICGASLIHENYRVVLLKIKVSGGK